MSPGDILADRYEVRRRVGRGGMGEVWAAHDRVLDRAVAVKVCRVDAGDDSVAAARFRREATATARLTHPHVVSLYDAALAAGQAFLVMELLPGPSVEELVRRDGPLEVEHALDLARQAAQGLEAIHATGVVHRDVKPSNLLLDRAGRVRIVDFGIAALAESTSVLTATDTVVGSAPYLSPEQAAGQQATRASDHYALGCVLMTMLTGRPPFTGEHPLAILRQHLDDTPPAPSRRRPEVPAAVDALVGDLLAKDPARRQAGIAALTAGAPGQRPAPVPHATAVLPAPDRTTPLLPPPPPPPSSPPGPRSSTRARRTGIAVAAVLLAAAGLLSVILLSGDDGGPERDEATGATPSPTSTGTSPDPADPAPPATPTQPTTAPRTQSSESFEAALAELESAADGLDGPKSGKTRGEVRKTVEEVRKARAEGEEEKVEEKLDELAEKLGELEEKDQVDAASAERLRRAVATARALA